MALVVEDWNCMEDGRWKIGYRNEIGYGIPEMELALLLAFGAGDEAA